MGLSDIDEDDPVPVPASAAPHQTGAQKTLTLDDLFGPPTVTSHTIPAPAPAPAQPATIAAIGIDPFFGGPPASQQPTTTGMSAPASELDALFMVDPNTAGSSSGAAQPEMIYVDDDDETNLLNLSRPARATQYRNIESCLDAFEKRVCGNVRIGNADNSLDHLTRNHDDNKVKARLLPLLSYYDVLGVTKDAEEPEIKRRYRQLALSLHPDKREGQMTREEEDLFKAITKAYEVLSDDAQRAEYDQQLATGALVGTPKKQQHSRQKTTLSLGGFLCWVSRDSARDGTMGAPKHVACTRRRCFPRFIPTNDYDEPVRLPEMKLCSIISDAPLAVPVVYLAHLSSFHGFMLRRSFVFCNASWRDHGISYVKYLNICTEALHMTVNPKASAKYSRFSAPNYVALKPDGSGGMSQVKKAATKYSPSQCAAECHIFHMTRGRARRNSTEKQQQQTIESTRLVKKVWNPQEHQMHAKNCCGTAVCDAIRGIAMLSFPFFFFLIFLIALHYFTSL
eukprot:gene4965-3563_t